MFFPSSTSEPSCFSSVISLDHINKGGCKSIKFNPLDGSLLAMTTGVDESYGGCLIIDRSIPVPHQTTVFTVSLSERLYDCSWSLTNQNLIIVAADSGRSHLIDINQDTFDYPSQSFSRNDCSVDTRTTSVDWQPDSGSFLSAYSNGAINHWCIGQPNPQHTYRRHGSKLVSSVTWNRQIPNVFASTCLDGYLRIRDIRGENSGINIQADTTNLNSCDWNWHGETRIATVSDFGMGIKVWDIKQTRYPIKVLREGQSYWVVKVKFSSHRQYQIASSSNDNRVVVWDYGPEENANPIYRMHDYHQKPVVGLDMNRKVEGQWASCGADGFHKWQHAVLPQA